MEANSEDSTVPAAPVVYGPDQLEAARQILRDRHPQAKARILSQARMQVYAPTRAGLVGLLMNLKPGTVTADELGAFLADNDPAVRVEAVRDLGVHGGPGARESLEDVLAQDDNAGVRLAAAFWLGGMRSRDSAKALGKALVQDSDPNVRAQAARSLKWVGTAEAKDLLKQGKGDKDARVRGIANER